MPIYEYQCNNCGKHFEEMQKITAEPLKHCSACGKDSLQRLISSTSFQLKGGGYYATDYKPKPKEESSEKPVAKEKVETKKVEDK